MFTVEEKDELLGSIREIKKRQTEMYNSMMEIKKAFPKNDLGDPDYDGHRKEHIGRREYDKIFSEYKVDVTKKILWSFVAFLGLVLGSGFIEQIKTVILR